MLSIAVVLGAATAFLSQSIWRKQFASGVSPAAVYALVWSVIWGANLLEILGANTITANAIVLSMIPLTGISIGELLGLGSLRRTSASTFVMIEDPDRLKTIAVRLALIAFISGVVVFVAAWIGFGNPFTESAVALKSARVTAGWDAYTGVTGAWPRPIQLIVKYATLLRGLEFSSLVLLFMYCHQKRIVFDKTMLLPISAAILNDAGWGSRTEMFTIMMTIIAFSALVPVGSKSEIRNRGQLARYVGMAIALSLTALVANTLSTQTHATTSGSIGSMAVPPVVESAVRYNVGTLDTFSETLDQNRLTWGRMSFQGVEQWLRLLRVLPKESLDSLPELLIWEEHIRSGSLNTYSWLRYLYSDFDVFGLLIIPTILGWIGGVSACRFARSEYRNNVALGTLSLCYLAILKSPQTMVLRDEAFVLSIVALLGSLWTINRHAIRGTER